MKRLAGLANSAFSFSGAEAINRLINLVAMMIVSRHYGVVEFGRFGAALALAAILTVLAKLIPVASLTRDLCQREEQRAAIMVNYLCQRLVVILGTTALLAIGSRLARPDQMALSVFCYLYLDGIQTVIGSRAGLMAQERFGEAGISSVTHSLLILAGAYIPVRLNLSLEITAASLAAAQALALLVVLGLSAFHGYSPMKMLRQRVDWSYMWSTLKENIPLWLALASIAGYSRINALLCQALRGNHETGLFTAAQRLFLGFGLLAAVYQQVTYPRMVRQVDSAERTGNYLESSGRVLVVVAQFVAVLTTLGGVGLMRGIWGRGFGAGGIVVQVLIWALTFAFASYVYSNILVAEGRTKTLLWITLVALCFNIPANMALIWVFGAVGAALTAILTEVLVLGGLLLALARYGRTRAVLWAIVRSSALAAAIVAAGLGAGGAGVPQVVTAPLGAMFYLGGAWIIGVLRRPDLGDTFRRLMPEQGGGAQVRASGMNGGPAGDG